MTNVTCFSISVSPAHFRFSHAACKQMKSHLGRLQNCTIITHRALFFVKNENREGYTYILTVGWSCCFLLCTKKDAQKVRKRWLETTRVTLYYVLFLYSETDTWGYNSPIIYMYVHKISKSWGQRSSQWHPKVLCIPMAL